MSNQAGRIVITGGAGLVGQNLVPRLKARGFRDLVVIDKARANVDYTETKKAQEALVAASGIAQVMLCAGR